MSKYLIINADDFGYNSRQNAAIKELLEKGLITSTSLMSVAEEAKDAVDFAREKDLEVGVHLTINSDEEDRRWHSITGSAALGSNGLPVSQKDLTFKATRKAVRAELEAQYRFIADRGVTVDHADNHCGSLYGINGRRFFLDAFDFCNEHGLPFRFPKTEGFLERQLGIKLPKAVVKVQKAVVSSGEKRNVKMLDDLVSNPYPMARINNYEALREYYINAVDNCIDGITEIFLHPALPFEGMDKEWQKRVFEYELLKSGDMLQRAKERGIQVVSWSVFNDIR